jgi:hypothetical protein
MGTTAHLPPVLHVAATWGTTIITLKHLARGESLGELPAPEGLDLSETIRATDDSWEVDPRGAITGKLRLRGRDETVEAIAKSALPFPVIKGDFGLLQYGQYGIFFQCAERPVLDSIERSRDVLVLLALLSSGALHAGALGFVRALASPPPIMKPLELANDTEYVARFGLRRASLEQPEPVTHDSSEPQSGAPVAKEGGPRTQGSEGKRGPGPTSPRAREARGPLGGAGDAIRDTLGSLPSVGDALALGGAQEIIGGGSGSSLHGGGDGGGGTDPRFGGGEMKTGWGLPRGGDYGHGHGAHEPFVTGAPRLDPIIDHWDRRRLGPEQVKRVVVQHSNAVRACYDTELVRDATVRGGLTLAWTITADGVVTNASVASSTINNARVERCVLRQARSWRFPTSEAPTNVASYPFVFGVGDR